ncbi:MAG: hypothetical protein HFJ17_05595 [Clostridia bacterium]|nr:hypothetical protein [Clostridia bacterium]
MSTEHEKIKQRRREIANALNSETFNKLYQTARKEADVDYQSTMKKIKDANSQFPNLRAHLESEEMTKFCEKMIRGIVRDMVSNIAIQIDADINKIMHETVTKDTVSKAIGILGNMITDTWNEYLQNEIAKIMKDVGERFLKG